MNFSCPACGGATNVKDTRHNSASEDHEQYLRRRRACIKCGNRFTTAEIITSLKPGKQSRTGAHSIVQLQNRLLGEMLKGMLKRITKGEVILP